MVANEVVMRIRTVYRGDKATRDTVRHLKQMQSEQKKINQIAMQTGVAAKTIEKAFKKAKDEARRFRSEFLSLMFFGMALERVFGGLLRASFQTFNKMTEGTNKAAHAANRMIAAWEFFKFSLFDALLRSDLFQTLVDKAIALSDWFANLSDSTQELIAKSVLWGMVIGAILVVVGTLAMGVTAIVTVFKMMGGVIRTVGALIAWALGPNVIKWIKKEWAGLKTWLSRGMTANFTSIGKFIGKWAIRISLLFRFLGGWITLAISGALWVITKLFGSFSNFVRAVVRGLILAGAAAADGWIESFSNMFDFFQQQLIAILNMVRRIARAFDRVMGTNIARSLPSANEIAQIGNALRNMRGSQMEKALDFTSKGWLGELDTQDSFKEFVASVNANTEELKEANKAHQIPGQYTPMNDTSSTSPTNIYVDEITMPNMSDPVKFAEDMNEMAKFWASRFGQAEFND